MTTVRKINVSQVEGDVANNTSTDEIRPFGETAFYIDESGPDDKLTLMMFDGERTHLKSKVLAAGVVYGSDADSGDGNNRDTIKLIPDAELHRDDGDFDNDQYLIIDPTEGDPIGHIHIRAGGSMDNSTADLFLGGEKNNVRVSDTNDRVAISADAGEGGIKTWLFDGGGALTLPGGIVFDRNNTSIQVGQGFHIASGEGVSIEAIDQTDPDNLIYKNWYFDVDGNLTLPAGGDILDSTGASVLGGGADTGTVSFNFNQISGNTNDGSGASYTKTVDINGNNYSTGAGSIGFLNFGADGEVEEVKAGWTVTFANGETRTVSQDAYQPLGTYWTISFNSAFVWDAGDVMPISFSSPDYIAASDPVLELKPDAETDNSWTFNGDGSIEFPDTTVQTTAYAPVTGEWDVTTGTNTYSFTLPSDGTYTMWVKCNIPNGIIVWNATASVSNSNVPAIGTQYAWNYTGGGSPILLTAIPNQIRGTAGSISTDNTYAGTTSNRFDFTIANTSGTSQTVYYGYTKV